MTGSQTLIARVGLGGAAAVAGLVLVSLRRLREMPQARFDRMLFAAFAVSRLGLFGVVFLLLKIAPRGDVPAFYFSQAEQVLRGLVPYRDFVSSYAPLHPYLDAGLISVWHSPLAILLASVLVELLLLPVWLRAGREFLTDEELRVASLLYLASPVSLQFATIDGQDNVVIAVLLALAVLLLLRSREFLAGIVLGASVAGIKFLPLLYAPAFFAAVSRRWRLAAGAMLVLVAVYGWFALLHTPVLGAVTAEANLWSAGDLPYLFEGVTGWMLPARLTDGILLLVLAGIFAWIAQAAKGASTEERMRVVTFGMAALTLALLLMSKKSWPPYLMLAMFPICLVAGHSRMRVVAFSVFSVVAVAEHSYWASLLAQCPSREFHRALLAGQRSAVVWLGMEVLLVAGYGSLLWEALRRVSGATKEAALSN
jgi:hypothetical protein